MLEKSTIWRNFKTRRSRAYVRGILKQGREIGGERNAGSPLKLVVEGKEGSGRENQAIHRML
jgi:hypothetical protein